VVLLVVAVLGGLALGRLRAPAGSHAPRVHLRRLPILAVGAAANVVAQLLHGDAATLTMAGSLALLLTFAVSNLGVTGIAVIGVGLLLNLLSVVLNNGMPVSGDALVAADVVEAEDLDTVTFTGPRQLETSSDRFAVLGDIIPLPIARQVLSFGDLIIVVGAGDAVRDIARRRRRAPSPGAGPAYPSAITAASADHDCGTAPSAAPEAGSQCSAKPEATAPATVDLASTPATSSSRALVAANQKR
jgi:hypothetical protein